MNSDPPKTFDELKKHAIRLIVDALYHIITFLYIAIIYGGAIYIENQLIYFVWWMMAPDAQKYPILAQLVDSAGIGLGAILLFCAVMHSLFSALSQIGVDWEFFQREKK